MRRCRPCADPQFDQLGHLLTLGMYVTAREDDRQKTVESRDFLGIFEKKLFLLGFRPLYFVDITHLADIARNNLACCTTWVPDGPKYRLIPF